MTWVGVGDDVLGGGRGVYYGNWFGDACTQCLLWMPKCSETAIVTTQSAPCQCITITTARHNVPTVKLDGSDRTVMTTQILHTE